MDTIPLSALNQYAYCPRRCYLIHVEGEFTDNIHTLRGSREHERVDQLKHEIREGVRVEFALPVWSGQLGLSGRCDVVEFHPNGEIYPVEYKHGKRCQWVNDDLQLAAQALCLEEALTCRIREGAIFHCGSNRRRVVAIDKTLREATKQTAAAVHALLLSEQRPPHLIQSQRCRQCSLNGICQPEMAFPVRKMALLHKRLFMPEEELG